MTLLKLDYDGAMPAGWMSRLGFVARQNRVRVLGVRIDRTRHGWHVTAQLTGRVAPLRVVLMQALCGSDWRRETYNGVRAMRVNGAPAFWRTRWNQLFVEHIKEIVL